MQWSTRDPCYSPCLHSVTLLNYLLFLLLGMTRSNLSEEGLLLAHSWRDYSPLWWRWGGGWVPVLLHSGSTAQTSLRAFLQWLTSSRDARFLRRPHTFQIAALIEDQVFKHKACRRTFRIKPQQWLRALAWFLNNPWIFAFSCLTQLVQILITRTGWLQCVLDLYLFQSVPHIWSPAGLPEKNPQGQARVLSFPDSSLSWLRLLLALTYVPHALPGTRHSLYSSYGPSQMLGFCFPLLVNILTILSFKYILHCG